jgi:hypothetical protein
MISLEQILSRTEIGKIKVLSYNGILEKKPEEMMYDFVHCKNKKSFLNKIKPVEVIVYKNDFFNIVIAETSEKNFNPVTLLDQNNNEVKPSEFNLNNKFNHILFDVEIKDYKNISITKYKSIYIIDKVERLAEYDWDFKNNIFSIEYVISNDDKTKDFIKIKLKKEKIDDKTQLIIDETKISFFKEGIDLEATYVDFKLYKIEGYYDAVSLAFNSPSKYLDLITKTIQNETIIPEEGIIKSFGNTPLSETFLKYVLKDQTGICENLNLYQLLINIRENKKTNIKELLTSLT